MSGHSKIRNKAIANVFSQMGLVEAWGSCMQRILNGAADYELPVPEVEVFDNILANIFKISRKTIAARLKDLKEIGLIERVGSARKGYWKINS